MKLVKPYLLFFTSALLLGASAAFAGITLPAPGHPVTCAAVWEGSTPDSVTLSNSGMDSTGPFVFSMSPEVQLTIKSDTESQVSLSGTKWVDIVTTHSTSVTLNADGSGKATVGFVSFINGNTINYTLSGCVNK